MKAHLQEAFAKDNREQYLRNKAKINARNNRYYAQNKERILAKRKSNASQASVKVLAEVEAPNPQCLGHPPSAHEYTRNPKT